MAAAKEIRFEVVAGDRIEITARTKRGRRVGELAAGFIGNEGYDWRFAVTYIGVATELHGRGIGEGLLRALLDHLPDGVERIHFCQVCSRGVLRLIERVVGPAVPDGTNASSIEALPERMDHATLRLARGPNLVVERARTRAAA